MPLRCRLPGVFALAAAALVPATALAHGGEGLTADVAWSAWNLTPEISGLILLILAIYARGALRRRTVARPVSGVRHTLFVTGMLALFLSLQSPIDPMGERLFLMHQIQHLLLRMVGPMLVILARPQGVLIAGLPEAMRRGLAAPLMKAGVLAATYTLLTRPVVAFALFVLSLYVWQIPSIHNIALLNPVIHWAMHLTMLAAGFLFFAMIFGRHDGPSAPSHFLRFGLLFATIVANILLGAITVFKSGVLYTAYDIEGRLFDIAPLTDETAGGFILWVPASMMSIIAIIIVIYDWNLTEKKRLRRGHGISGPDYAAADTARAVGADRIRADAPSGRLGLLLGLAALTMFGLVIGTGVFVVSLG
ncbi:cytochrome c oxidase assembly protein [Alterinioella nitratireducens]|uniref:cytochrome c oxidase assembly protein n=1 Tax=Alterinioella nitratireducens TaxID=2735915 RepID=UPI001551E4DA|nr:cytochrome c oxidase assembly protein [Alterinioella nitratireducens]NPD21532.1 cytochrome c oxidase assembly protein [Alterinioella nitratireducens]